MSAVSILGPAEETAKRRPIGRRLLRWLSMPLFFLAWQVFASANQASLHLMNPLLLPDPLTVLRTGWDMMATGELETDILASMVRILEGFTLAGAVGVGLGILVARVPLAADALEPIIEMFRPIPSFAFLPLLILWLGIGETSKVVFIAYAAAFPVFSATLQGIKGVDPLLLRAASALGASPGQTVWNVVLPAALPSIFTGLRIGFGIAFHVIVAAEFIAADAGLGYMINDARTSFLVPRMLLGAAVIGLIGFLFHLLFEQVERRLLAWRPAQDGA